ncbi:hypothetical protein GOV14_00060 [Candidatus Pacearchaeota archaeon]|nr:hypothetical protein [Candidatus Pacearchaeota archaeon]
MKNKLAITTWFAGVAICAGLFYSVSKNYEILDSYDPNNKFQKQVSDQNKIIDPNNYQLLKGTGIEKILATDSE